MSKANPLLGLAVVFALAALAPRRPSQSGQPMPAPIVWGKPKRGKPDLPGAHPAPVAVWALVQTLPRFAVLATGDNLFRLKAEMDVLIEMHAERRESLTYYWEIRPANHLFG